MVKRVIQRFDLLINRVSRGFWQFSGAAIVLMAFVVTYNVGRRYIFRHQDPYAYVITCILMLLCVVFAIAYTQSLRQHIRVDLIDRYLPERAREVMLNVVGPTLGLICISILVWKSWGPAWFALQIGDTAGSGVARAPNWPWRMAVTVGGGLLCLVFISQILRYFVLLRDKTINQKE